MRETPGTKSTVLLRITIWIAHRRPLKSQYQTLLQETIQLRQIGRNHCCHNLLAEEDKDDFDRDVGRDPAEVPFFHPELEEDALDIETGPAHHERPELNETIEVKDIEETPAFEQDPQVR
jgi:hypothetical protein